MRVVTIDFNTIMYPCIKLYDHLINNPNENPTMIWNALEHDFDMKMHLSFDAKVSFEIARFIKDYQNEHTAIIAVEKPSQVIDYLDDIDELLDLIHMGFHHNIMNSDEEYQMLTTFSDYTDENWLGHLIAQNMTKRVRWIKCPNSLPVPMEIKDIIKDHTDFSICPISFLNKLKNSEEAKTNKLLPIDHIILIKSDLYVPYEYQYLFTLICECFSIPMGG